MKEPTEKAENLFNEIVAIKNSKISDCINETTISGSFSKRKSSKRISPGPDWNPKEKRNFKGMYEKNTGLRKNERNQI